VLQRTQNISVSNTIITALLRETAMPASLKKGLDTPVLRKTPSQFTAMKKPGNEHNLSGVKLATIVSAEPVVAPHVVTLTLMESTRKCRLAAILIVQS
jgi:hypothetical protein